MKKKAVLFAIIGLTVLLTGCWDRTEINQYAFWMGTLLERLEGGDLKVSAQIAIPSRIGFSGNRTAQEQRGNIIISAVGRTLMDTCDKIQSKLPRRLFIGHRRSVFLGESLAKKGISDSLDMYTRNMDTSLRTSVFVVLGEHPEQILTLNSPFDPFSANAAVDQDNYSRIGDKALRDFIVAMESETTSPILSAIDLQPLSKEEQGKTFEIERLALFNRKSEMVGLLDEKESLHALWIMNKLKRTFLTGYISEGKGNGGYVTVSENNMASVIRTSVKDGQITVAVRLTGKGTIKENRTSLDLLRPGNVLLVQQVMEEQTKETVEETIREVQQKYGTDIFGFGEAVHRQHPYLWKELKKDWLAAFPKMKVSVEVHLKIKRIGAQGKRV
ncbi:Ger(x)C family spore germination protein [Paenibacillus arenilitoris]|uniref:Ger(X)C family spore germination protein n=1 Tax=Paenibacillus arenilitoris TaxID=2772299 RepID=A0A927H637_9BACL|nr:Ger(x)C family spore germination protein [Paenibacillus arenilitoris]MBD2869087.1 Ger(x)C family spore germination protein [Paenibacillus arenilitoris]